MFPTKALAQDQLRALQVLLGLESGNRGGKDMNRGVGVENVQLPIIASILDGDTSPTDREIIAMTTHNAHLTIKDSRGSQIILTNPGKISSLYIYIYVCIYLFM